MPSGLTYSAMVTAAAKAWRPGVLGVSGVNKASGIPVPISLWVQMGGATPASGAGQSYDNTNSLLTVPLPGAPAGKSLYLAGVASALYAQTQGNVESGTLLLLDRYVATSGVAENTTSAQTVNTVALPSRAGTGAGVAMFFECYATGPLTPPTSVTVAYTNSAGGSSTATTPITTSAGFATASGALFPLALAAGDVGVQSVQTVTFGSAASAAGTGGITLAQVIAILPTANLIDTGLDGTFDAFDCGLPVLPADACLVPVWMSGSTGIPVVDCLMKVIAV